jgi:hypothetical protein
MDEGCGMMQWKISRKKTIGQIVGDVEEIREWEAGLAIANTAIRKRRLDDRSTETGNAGS